MSQQFVFVGVERFQVGRHLIAFGSGTIKLILPLLERMGGLVFGRLYFAGNLCLFRFKLAQQLFLLIQLVLNGLDFLL